LIEPFWIGKETAMKKYIVELTTEERSRLQTLVGKGLSHQRKHAQMLLKADQGAEGPRWKDVEIAEAFDCHPTTVENLRRRLVEQGLDSALEHGNRGSYRARKLDGKAEAHLIALTRMEPPEGRNRWGVRLLADQMVAQGHVESCSHMTVQRTLKKMNLSLT
jgi:transposase